MGRSKIFKCGFDIADYKDILPSFDEYTKGDYVLNYDDYEKGNIEECFWKKHRPTKDEIKSQAWRSLEVQRILKTGVWICIKEEILWVPPNLYLALQYGTAGGSDLGFRLKMLKSVYFKKKARDNPFCKGTLKIKNRADGATTESISDAMWEVADGNMTVGNIGIQSKTRADAINPCWSTVQTFWQGYPQWLKELLYPDFASGDSIAQKMLFMRDANDDEGLPARNITMQYYPCVFNAMDGKHNMKKCILDEICKWKEAEFYDTFINYSQFIMPGFERRGMFDLFSSPADVECKSNEQVYDLWKNSNPDELNEKGITKSGIMRHFSNPLDGIQGSYDKYGDADPQAIYDKIMEDRAAMPKEKRMGQVRAFPLNESEMFESQDSTAKQWTNGKGIEARKIYLMGAKWKNSVTKEPKVVYGNLEWKDGIVDTDVDFRQADTDTFNEFDARFGIAYMPQNKESLKYGSVYVRGINIGDRPLPPQYSESCLGIDPYSKRYRTGNNNSKGAMVNHKFRDIFNTGVVRCPTLLYIERPSHADIFHEDAIKAAVFNRSMVQPESITDKIIDYFEDRGYMDWLLPKIGHKQSSLQKGDAPTGGKNLLMGEIIGLIDAITNTPLLAGDDYPLERVWFYELLESVSKFNKADTHTSDAMMAWGQALLGSVKMLHQKVREKSELNDSVFAYLLG